MNPPGAVWAVPDNFSTISSFNHMLMSCFIRDSTKEIISAFFFFLGGFPLWFLYGFALMWKCFPANSSEHLLLFAGFLGTTWAKQNKHSEPRESPVWTLFHERFHLELLSNWESVPALTRPEAGHCCYEATVPLWFYGSVQAVPEKA